ncbi:MAG: sodium:calcium antiporter [Armatimonadetes bacterium]|nr:sodium:calcium antiporter [Armatimonadota bacterium]
MAFAGTATLPWIALRFSGWHGEPLAVAAVSGLAILGAAFLLSWAAEVAQMDISQSLALAFLALISILPEYAVDMVFAWKAGKELALPLAQQQGYAGLAAANMTGANRLLIGLGWSAVVLIYWARSRHRSVTIEPGQSTEMTFLALATLWSFTIPLRGEIGMLDLVVLLGLFVVYMWRASTAEHEEPELTGPPLALSVLPRLTRRLVTVGFFVWAALVILASAEPFAEGLVATGKHLGIEEFLLVQWLAPLASEAPEFIVASLFALRGNPSMGLGTLISSKVNQWTLLVAMLPLVFSFGAGHPVGMALDARQVEEVFLTSAQSLFALAVVLNFEMSMWEAGALIGLFITQLFFTQPEIRYAYAIAYVVLTVVIILRDPSRVSNLIHLVRTGGRR